MSAYPAIRPIDHGLIQFGTNGYGGFAYRTGTLEGPSSSQSPDPTRRFITEHNLALFWRRPGLFPRTKGFPVPLLDTYKDGQSGLRNRPPGAIRVDCQPIRYRQRNLLAGQLIQENNSAIRLWAVNDATDHKMLLQYELQLEQPCQCRRKKLLRIAGVVDEMGSENGQQNVPTAEMKLANEAFQLRAMEGSGQFVGEGNVFVRSKRSLDLANPVKAMIEPIFKHPVHSFVQIPYMEDELAIVDSSGLLFKGEIGNPNSFSRVKMAQKLMEVCPTDCPRALLALGERELRELDLRDSSAAAGILMYAQAPLGGADIDGPLRTETFAKLSTRDQFWHCNMLDQQLETVLLTGTRQHVVLDRRMPGIALLTMEHAEMEGADYCVAVPAFTDPESGARIFSFYSLTQIRKPALSHWALAYHPKEALWSSLGSKYQLDTPRTIFHHTKAWTMYNNEFDVQSVPEITRAFHYQPLHQDLPISQTRAMLFRQMEGGELWYENVFFDPMPKLAQDEPLDSALHEDEVYEGNYATNPVNNAAFTWECLERIQAFQQKRVAEKWTPPFFEGISQYLMDDQQQKQLEVSVLPEQISNAPLPNAFAFAPTDQLDPFDGVNEATGPELYLDWNAHEPIIDLESIEEKHLFSTCVYMIWRKTSALFREQAERRSKKEGKTTLAEHLDDEEEEEEEEDEMADSEEEEGDAFETKMEQLNIEAKTLRGGIGKKEELMEEFEKPQERKRGRKQTTSSEPEESSAADQMRKKKAPKTSRQKPSAGMEAADEPMEEEAAGAEEEGDALPAWMAELLGGSGGVKQEAAAAAGRNQEEEELEAEEYDFDVELD